MMHCSIRPITAWHLPTLTHDGRGLLLRCAATEAVPTSELSAATVAVGVDWSPSTLGAAAITTDTDDGLVSDFQGYTYDDRDLGIKLARLQTEGQFLHRKAARLARLAENAPPQLRSELEAKITVLACSPRARCCGPHPWWESGDPDHRACSGAPVSGQDRPDTREAAASPCPL
ncbi:hypothetical protein EV641_12124 [Rhodococcus sp. SMB37]|nr:hypothetical protein EV641_12124 [Rhodococcus sp. SMB37]